MKRDIVSREDIKLLVDSFYKQVLVDDVIGHFFTEVVVMNFEKHMPVMYDFWESTLLGNYVYKGNPMVKHMALDQKQKLEPQHFERWLSLWEKTTKKHFVGPTSVEAVMKAKQIAQLMEYKVSGTRDDLLNL